MASIFLLLGGDGEEGFTPPPTGTISIMLLLGGEEGAGFSTGTASGTGTAIAHGLTSEVVVGSSLGDFTDDFFAVDFPVQRFGMASSRIGEFVIGVSRIGIGDLFEFDGPNPKPFIVLEITYADPHVVPLSRAGGRGSHAHGTLILYGLLAQQGLTVASDTGYRTRSDDPGGVVSYPPVVDPGFQIDVSMALDLGKTNVAAAWGSVVLSNANRQYDQLTSGGSPDGRRVRALKGMKAYDPVRQYWMDPPVGSLSEIFAGMAQEWYLTETALMVPLRDATYWLDRPYKALPYLGTGRYEGGSGQKGISRPRTRGGTNTNPVCNVTPTLIDSSRLIYQYNDAAGTVQHLYEGAAEVFAYSGDLTDLWGTGPSPGHYYTDNSRGLFRLGSTPVHTITADVTGSFPNNGYVSTWASLLYWILVEDMGLPLENMGTQFDSVDASFPYVAGLFFPAGYQGTGVQAIEPLLAGVGAHLVPFANGRLEPVMLRAITAEIPTAVFSTLNIFSIVSVQLPASLNPPPRRITFGYNINYTVQSSDLNVASSSPDRLEFVAQKSAIAASSIGFRYEVYGTATESDVIMGALLNEGDAQQVASEMLTLFGGSVRRRLYDITVQATAADGLEIGGVVEVNYPLDELDSGRVGRIVRRALAVGDIAVTLRVLI